MRVIITGGATGIGKSCVQSLFFSGMNIDLIYFTLCHFLREAAGEYLGMR